LRNVLDTPHNRKRPVGQAQKRGATKQDKARESKLMRMLKDTNPIMARAAQGAVAMPGPIQATNRVDQLKAMKDFLFKISSNPNPRSRPVDLKILNDAARSFGFRQARAVNGQWKLPGMKTLLHNHQLVGVSWMLRQEFSPHGPYGGILGDQMGLGKTVQMLAAMSANRPSEEDVRAGRHQTLIVAPAIAIDQWKREILTHCEESFISKIHHFKQSQKLEEWMWKSADVM
jgi:SNF2 family DNA or RNA helicase